MHGRNSNSLAYPSAAQYHRTPAGSFFHQRPHCANIIPPPHIAADRPCLARSVGCGFSSRLLCPSSPSQRPTAKTSSPTCSTSSRSVTFPANSSYPVTKRARSPDFRISGALSSSRWLRYSNLTCWGHRDVAVSGEIFRWREGKRRAGCRARRGQSLRFEFLFLYKVYFYYLEVPFYGFAVSIWLGTFIPISFH